MGTNKWTGPNKGTEGIKSITEVIQRYEVHVESRLIASVPLIGRADRRRTFRIDSTQDEAEHPALSSGSRSAFCWTTNASTSPIPSLCNVRWCLDSIRCRSVGYLDEPTI